MRRFQAWIAAGVILSAGSALGQPPGFGRPKSAPVSPYLNLLNRRNSTAFNYYQLYRPQQEFRGAYQELDRGVYRVERENDRQSQAIEQRLANVEERARPGVTLSTTGHPTSFMSYGSYFSAGPSAQ